MGNAIVIILGNVGQDPSMRYTQDGKPVTNFSVAVNRGNDRTTWFRVSAWNKLAEVCNQYVRKGMTVQVTGIPKASAWIDRAGHPEATLEIIANDVQFASRRSDGMEEDDFIPPDDVGESGTNDIPF